MKYLTLKGVFSGIEGTSDFMRFYEIFLGEKIYSFQILVYDF